MSSTVFFLIFRTNELLSNMHMIYACFRIVSVYFIHLFDHYFSHVDSISFLTGTFEIGLPNPKSRLQILNLFLEKHNLTDNARKIIPAIAKVTEGYSGSDLKELW